MQRSEIDKLISKNSGGGIIDSILKPFTAERYPGERIFISTINIWETDEFYGSKK